MNNSFIKEITVSLFMIRSVLLMSIFCMMSFSSFANAFLFGPQSAIYCEGKSSTEKPLWINMMRANGGIECVASLLGSGNPVCFRGNAEKVMKIMDSARFREMFSSLGEDFVHPIKTVGPDRILFMSYRSSLEKSTREILNRCSW